MQVVSWRTGLEFLLCVPIDDRALASAGRSLDTSGPPEVVNALRANIAAQTEELEEMRAHILALEAERDEEVRSGLPWRDGRASLS